MLEIRDEQFEQMRQTLLDAVPGGIINDLRAAGADARRVGDAVVGTDAAGRQVRVERSPDGRHERLVLPSGYSYTVASDERGRVTSLEAKGHAPLAFEHDDQGRITSVERPGIDRYAFAYDDGGKLADITYPDGGHRRFTYHPSGHVSSVTDRLGARTAWERESDGTLTGVVDPLGRRTTYETIGGATSGVVFPDGTREDYWYDPDTGVAVITGRDGEPVIQQTNADGAIDSVLWSDGDWVELAYDDQGGLASAHNAWGTVDFINDHARRTTKERTPHGVVRIAHDEDGRWERVVTPTGDEVRYTYDVDGRLSAIVDWSGRTTRFSWSDSGALAEIRYGNGLVERRAYSTVGRLGHARIERGGSTLSEQRYGYDSCARMTSHEDVVEGWTRQIAYDGESRVLEVRDERGGRLERFDYDAAGNMIRDGESRIHIGSMDEPLAIGDEAIDYDALGNMVRLPGPKGTVENRFAKNGTLRETTVGGRTIRYSYDGLGRRVAKTDGERSWRFGWLGNQLIWEELLVPGKDPVRRDYLYVPDSVEPIAFREHGRTYYMQCDGRGAVIRVFRDDGELVWSARYDAFGRAEVDTAKVRQPLRLLGQYEDEETGLFYNQARYYCPWLKSYLSRDPKWFHPDATNYSYCRQDPYNNADVSGAFLGCLLAAVAVVAVGAVVGAVASAIAGGDPWAGAAEGAITALGGVLGALGGPVGFMIGSTVGSMVGAAVGNGIERHNKGLPFSWACAAEASVVAGLFDAALLGLGKIPGVKTGAKKLGSALLRRGRHLAEWAGPGISRAARAAKQWATTEGSHAAKRAGEVLAERAPRVLAAGKQAAKTWSEQVTPRIGAAASKAKAGLRSMASRADSWFGPHKPEFWESFKKFAGVEGHEVAEDVAGDALDDPIEKGASRAMSRVARRHVSHAASEEVEEIVEHAAEHELAAGVKKTVKHAGMHAEEEFVERAGHKFAHETAQESPQEVLGNKVQDWTQQTHEPAEGGRPEGQPAAPPAGAEGQPAARVSDDCEHGNSVVSGSPDTIVGGQPQARQMDKVSGCPSCPLPPGKIVGGSETVFVNSKPAARITDEVECGSSSEPAPGGGHAPVTSYAVKEEDNYVALVFSDDRSFLTEGVGDLQNPPPPDRQPERKPMTFLDGLSLELELGSKKAEASGGGGSNAVSKGEPTVIVGG